MHKKHLYTKPSIPMSKLITPYLISRKKKSSNPYPHVVDMPLDCHSNGMQVPYSYTDDRFLLTLVDKSEWMNGFEMGRKFVLSAFNGLTTAGFHADLNLNECTNERIGSDHRTKCNNFDFYNRGISYTCLSKYIPHSKEHIIV